MDIITQNTMTKQAMTFYPSKPDFVRKIGGVEFHIYHTPAIFVKAGDALAQEFSSQIDAEHYMAEKIAQQHGYDSFFRGLDCKPPKLTHALEAAWVDGWEQACAVGRNTLKSEWRETECHDEWQPEYSIEDDNLWHSRGMW